MFLALNVSEYNNTKMTFNRDKSCYGMYFKFVKIEVHVQWSSTDSWGVYACIDAVALKLPKKKTPIKCITTFFKLLKKQFQNNTKNLTPPQHPSTCTCYWLKGSRAK